MGNENLFKGINFESEKPKVEGFKIEVDIVNTDFFKDIAEIISEFCKDERVPENIREEYKERIMTSCDNHINKE